MRLFQNSGIYPRYLARLNTLARDCRSFEDRLAVTLEDRFGASHILSPVLARDRTAFFTNGDDMILQRLWARDHGLTKVKDPESILLAQMEEHRTEVFYNLDPVRYPSSFIRRLPASVKCRIAWRAAPSPGSDFSAYDLIVSNFPQLLNGYRQLGWNVAPFFPAHDPALDEYAGREDRDIDVLFVGGYSRHHMARARMLEHLAEASGQLGFTASIHLDVSRLTTLAEGAWGRLLPLRRYRLPPALKGIVREPTFGRDLYSLLGRARIVVNGAIDMAGEERGNMRCFEAMGARCVLVSDHGRYPAGMTDGENMLTYSGEVELVEAITSTLRKPDSGRAMANRANCMIRDRYSKERQYAAFVELCA